MQVLITGSSGLIGSEAVAHYDALGHQVVGIDNNMRAYFSGWRRRSITYDLRATLKEMINAAKERCGAR